VRLLKVLLVLVVVAVGVAGFYAVLPYGPSTETFVEVVPGSGAAGIARSLEQGGVVRSAAAFEALRVWKQVRGGGSQTLKAGEYRFDHPMSLVEVYEKVRRGDVYTVTVVIPEGFNIFDVAHAVAAAGLSDEGAFLAAERKHTELIRQWSPRADSLEGYLFPDTYKFSRHATPVQMLAAMVRRFGQEMAVLGMVPGGAAGLSAAPSQQREGSGREDSSGAAMGVERVVILASLVEREVHVDGERALVAGVFENRLAAGMPLQTDPAVQYASELRGTWTGVIHQSELHSDSAYNTYAHAGLPPGPICNPGLASLRAALRPARTDYLYFVADARGATRFSATLGEHNGQVEAYRAGRR
jgi:UPF0755 protein